LNQNAKAEGLAGFPGTFRPLLEILESSEAGLVQLPCPEMEHLGPHRPLGTDTVEQYDTPKYRVLCGKLSDKIISEIQAYRRAGYRVLGILGVEGSPSCSVVRAPRLVAGRRRMGAGSGLFVGALKEKMILAGLEVPVIGIPESGGAAKLRGAMKIVRNLVEG
jgi:hypothetical protein